MAATAEAAILARNSISGRDLWRLSMPELLGAIEIDLAQHHLISDLDDALNTRTWHFVRGAVERLLDIEGTWLRKAVDDVRRRRARIQADHDGGPGLQAGPS